MFPVSGAEQLQASGAKSGERPMIFAKMRVFEIAEARAMLVAWEKEIPEPELPRLAFQLVDQRMWLPAVLPDFVLMPLLVGIDALLHELRERSAQVQDAWRLPQQHALARILEFDRETVTMGVGVRP